MIVVTGYGIKAPQIRNSREFAEVLEQGRCTLRVREQAGPDLVPLVCGEIEEKLLEVDGVICKHLPRVARLALAAAVEAVDRAGARERLRECRVAVILGTSTGGLIDIEKGSAFSAAGNYRKFPLRSAGLGSYHSLPAAVAAHFGTHGMTLSLATGCTASTDAMVLGKLLLETNQADLCIVGGSEAPITPYAIYSFAKLKSITPGVELEQTGCPFSSETDDFVLSEGAGILVLERLEDARDRGAVIQGIFEKGVSNNDGVSIYESDPTGEWMVRALKETLEGHVPTFVNSQALGLTANDRIEQSVHRSLFTVPVPVTSLKGNIGHPFGAVGAMQSISALISMEKGFIPATIRSSGVGFEGLPIVFQTRYVRVDSVAVTSHGYGGNNACLLLAKY